MINRERLVKEFIEMAKIPSPSKKEGALAAYLQGKLAELGFQVRVDEQAGREAGADTGNIIAYLPGNREGVPPVFFSAHMDTVTPCECISPQVEGQIIRTDGSSILGADDKAGIAAILEAVRNLQEEGAAFGPLELVFTICEEIGLLGARYLDYSLLRSKYGYVLDSGKEPGAIINRAPAHDKFQAVIHGKAAHAGVNPEEGISAIQVAAAAISSMKLLRIDHETTANIGFVSGGGATNIVTDRVELKGETRSLNSEKLDKQNNHIRECLESACREHGARLEFNLERSYEAFQVQEDHPVVRLAAEAAGDIGLTVRIIPTGGGSDVNIINTKGITAVNLATGMSKVHTTDEYIKIADLESLAGLVAAIIKRAADS